MIIGRPFSFELKAESVEKYGMIIMIIIIITWLSMAAHCSFPSLFTCAQHEHRALIYDFAVQKAK